MSSSTGESTPRPLRERARGALDASGPLARALPGFTARASQLAMAEAVADLLESGGKLVCEAGTGTGKTLAYLVPALLSGRRVIVSTGTRTLQDQLYERDLPLAIRAVASGRRCAILKGRANYLCLQRLGVALAAGETRRDDADQLARIDQWSAHTRTGDIAEVDDVAEDAAIWRRVTSTTENCLGQSCPRFDDCHVLDARRRALIADVVVVNHHLFMADLSLKQEGFGELLPGAEAVIIDEAHQLPDTATAFFGQSVSSGQLRELARDAAAAHLAEAGDMAALPAAAQGLEHELQNFLRNLGGSGRRPWHGLLATPRVQHALHALRNSLAALAGQLGAAAERGRQLAHVSERAVRIVGALLTFVETQDDDDGHVAWADVHERGFSLQRSPLEVGERFAGQALGRVPAWVFTSATLAVGDSLAHYCARLALDDAHTAVFQSPFDYRRQSLCYLPPGLPQPSAPDFTAALVERVLPVLEASGGRAFLLFTSHAGLRRALALLEGRTRWPLLVQGTAPRAELLRRFRETPAVLLGTASFWEGVDVAGRALSCVIIDKLPFAPPDDPLVEARSRALKARGEDAFRMLQLPQAVLTLKQGCGRLIRSENDSGLLMLCDPRLRSRGYGRVFLDSLPDMPITADIEDVRDFFARVDASERVAP